MSKLLRRSSIAFILIFISALLVLFLLKGRFAKIHPIKSGSALRCPCPLIFAHRGASAHRPGNTMPSFRLARQSGADFLEMDVHKTRDGIVVVSHDADLKRVTGKAVVIKEHDYAEIEKFDAGFMFTPDKGKSYPYRGKGIKVPTLAEVLREFPDMRLNIDIKQSDPPMERELWEVIQKNSALKRVLVTSFNNEVFERWKKVSELRITRGAPGRSVMKFIKAWLFGVDYRPEIHALQLPYRRTLYTLWLPFNSKGFIEFAHRAGLQVHYWTVNEPDEIRELLELGADGIFTDYPGRARKIMSELRLR